MEVRVLRQVKAVLLDMGGVLLDMGNPHGMPVGKLDWRGRQAMLEILRRGGRSATLEDLGRLVFEPWRGEYERRNERVREARWEPHLRRLRRATGSRSRDLTLLRAWFQPYAEQVALIRGAPEALAALKGRGLRLALISNTPLPGRLYARLLDRLGLSCFFDCLRFSYDAGSRKPSPVMVRTALDELGVAPGEAVMVGDRKASDVAAGRAAGTATGWVRSPHAEGPAPDFEIGSIAELPSALGGA